MKQILALLLLLCGAALADETGYQSVGSAANESSPTTSWVVSAGSLVDSLIADDDARATYSGTTNDTLYCTNFSMGVPTDATIDSIWIGVDFQGDVPQSSRRRLVLILLKDGTTPVGELSVFIQGANGTDAFAERTGGTNPLWNTTWTETEVNASTFGVAMWQTATQSGNVISIDVVQIRIAYTPAAGGGSRIMMITIGDD